MYKTTSERRNFLSRTASHSTKPYGDGRVETLPPNARPEEETYLRLREQFIAVTDQIHALEQALPQAKGRERTEIGTRLTYLGEGRRKLVDAMNAAATQAFAETFYFVARQMLSAEIFGEVYEETEALIGRPRIEVLKKADGKIKISDQHRFDRRR